MTREDFEFIAERLDLMCQHCDRKWDCGRENKSCFDCGEIVQDLIDKLEKEVEE